jgi:DNA sulfur modification protein DndB
MRGRKPSGVRWLKIQVVKGRCGQLPVVLGSAPAKDLWATSFADILNEGAQSGYQRPCDRRHAQEFRLYIEQPGSTTIPLTFNLRGRAGRAWRLRPARPQEGARAVLEIRQLSGPNNRVMARVDCQHRLEMMGESSVPLTFQCYLGLTPEEEMRIFNVINGKAKGLSPSLLDYHNTQLLTDVAKEHPELFIAKKLNDDPESVWHNRVKLGGAATQGTHRRVTLRGMRHGVALLLQNALIRDLPILRQYEIVSAFWRAVTKAWPDAWNAPRKHLITKGIGVQGLSLLAGDIVKLAMGAGEEPVVATFERYLRRAAREDWSNAGSFKGLGGRSGAQEVHERLARGLLTFSEEARASRVNLPCA